MHRRFNILVILLPLIIFSFLPKPALAQFYFGKNKVQYNSFDWQVLSTEHFNIYYYTEETELAEYAAKAAEDSYKILASRFAHEIYSPIPIIIYSHPNYFSQTNVTWSFVPESVAGFTEFIKGRVVIPFSGRWYEFDHVIRHELVHVFMLSKLGRTSRDYGRFNAGFPPLWFTEGLAECWSRDEDAETDLILRDMVINGNLPSLANFGYYNGSYYLYKLGESVCNFIQDEYGADKITRLLDNWHEGKRFENVLAITLGESIDDLSRKWIYYLKKKYFPQISKLDLPEVDAEKVTRKGFALSPVPITLKNEAGIEEAWVVYKANKLGYSGIYIIPADGDEGRAELILKGEQSSRFESLHLTTSSIDQFENRLLTFSSKSKEKDVLYVYDLNERKIIDRFEFDDLVGITSPHFSPTGDRIVFTGYRPSGMADLYIVDRTSGQLKRLTSDIYYDGDPSFGYSGRSIIFSSDRGENGFEGNLSLYRLDLDKRTISRLTYGPYRDRSPVESPDGKFIVFDSDRGPERAYNIFRLDPDGNLRQLSHMITGAFDPRFDKSENEIYLSAYQNLGFQIYKLRMPDSTTVIAQKKPVAEGKWQPTRIAVDGKDVRTVKYTTAYSLDIAQSLVGYDAVYGTIGGIQAAVSDMLGNNTFIILLSNTAREKSDFLSSFNFGLTYLKRTNRLNWGFGIYHLYDEYYNDYDSYYFERVIGGLLYASYPFSKFERIESTVYMRYSDKDYTYFDRDRIALPLTQTLSFVTDNTLWDATGPLDGRRLNLTVGHTFDFRRGVNFSRMASADFRYYYRLGMYSAVANRFFAYTSRGLEPQRIYFGGSWSFRGFSRRHFYNRNILFHSVELRFPLLNDLILGFPVGQFHLRGIRAAFFHDTGTAWDNRWKEWQGSFGASFRFALGYLVVLRFDLAWIHDFHKITPGARTEFFFGWNF